MEGGKGVGGRGLHLCHECRLPRKRPLTGDPQVSTLVLSHTFSHPWRGERGGGRLRREEKEGRREVEERGGSGIQHHHMVVR